MIRLKPILAAASLALALLHGPAARADIINGDFSAGLAGWTADPVDSVSAVGGQAVIQESQVFEAVVLYQDFVIPVGAQTLTFTLVSLTDEPAAASPPDSFSASLLDPITLDSLVPTFDVSSDAYYFRELVQGVTQGETATGVTLAPSPTNLPLQVILDVSGLGGQTARINFRLFGGGPGFDASVTIDDVAISGVSVPEPGSLALLGIGTLGVVLARRRRVGVKILTR